MLLFVLSSTDFPIATTTTIPDIIPHRTNYTSFDNVANNTTSITVVERRVQNHTNMNHFHEMSSVCPGAAEYLSSQSEPAIFRVSVSDCRRPGYDPRSRHGVVYGVCNDSTTFCQFLAQVPRGMVVRVWVKLLSKECHNDWRVTLYNRWPLHRHHSVFVSCTRCPSKPFMSNSSQMYMLYYNSPPLQIQFETVKYTLSVVHVPDFGGYVTFLAPEGISLGSKVISYRLRVPHQYVIMINFEIFKHHRNCFWDICLVWRERIKTLTEHTYIIKEDFARSVHFFNTSVLEIHIHLYYDVPATFGKFCTKMLFSFHHESRVPQRLNGGLYNCSVEDYWRFQQHFQCNAKVECEDGRDETEHCPFSSPACQGWVASHHKCYRPLFDLNTTPSGASEECRKHGSSVASVRTDQELKDFLNVFSGRVKSKAMIGLHVGVNYIPFMYRYFYRWFDNTVMYNTNQIKPRNRYHFEMQKRVAAHGLSDHLPGKIAVYRIVRDDLVLHVVCEKPIEGGQIFSNQTVQLSAAGDISDIRRHTRQALVDCPEGHATHTFLACDPTSRCEQTPCMFVKRPEDNVDLSATHDPNNTVELYSCSSYNMMVHYTLLCDFKWDCQDGSDESFCQHPPCDAFTCINGQCVSPDRRCDGVNDCLDDTDETVCSPNDTHVTEMPKQQKHLPFLIDLDGRGYFTYRVLNTNEKCPETHYLCRFEWIYCLPVYTRCNGYNDCVYGEDEKGCESITCPGLYRCRGSAVCLHSDHLCDGWPQCPQRDDEWLCDMICPAQCLCQGHVFLCPQPFYAYLFPQLRYLDAQGSGMTPSDLRKNAYIVFLNLASCFLSFLPSMKFANMMHLDLSNNKLTSVAINLFLPLGNLQSLSLQGNPLTSITSTRSHFNQNALRSLDLSRTYLGMFDSWTVRQFLRLQYINLSYASLQSVGSGGFQRVPYLRELDVRGNDIDRFSVNIFNGLGELTIVFSSNQRLCCKDIILPATKCLAPSHFLSSCENMIQSKIYRSALWFVAIVASVSNLTCIIGHYLLTRLQYGMTVIVLLASLQCANLCMGIYASIIVMADTVFSGWFLHHENQWKDSLACKVAGFLSLLSSEVSCLTIFLLTLDHLTALCFSLNKIRFSRRSACVACGVTWFIGICIAALPLLPGLSHWGRYGRTALCGLMLQEKATFSNAFNVFHTTTSLNSFVSIVVFVAQVIIYRATPKHWIQINPNKNPACTSVDLIMKIAGTDIAAWLPITTVSVLSLAGVTESQKVNGAMAVMVLPLNSALNPLLCLWHLVALRLQQKQEQRLLSVLRSRCKPVAKT